MPSVINASSSGAGGLISTGDSSGSLNIQTAGTTAIAISSAQVVTVQGVTVGRGAGAVSTNTAVGASALAANTTGAFNTALGNIALTANTTAQQNVAVGHGTLQASNADFNVAVGSNALRVNTSGANNTALGHNSLFSNTTAANNVAVGYQAGYSNTTGASITAIGSYALYSNTTGNYNTAVGSGVGGSFGPLIANTTGLWNIAVGTSALTTNTTGGYNTAIGGGALQLNTTASYNTAVGYQAAYSNTTGAQILAIGYQAAYTNATGNYNLCIGRQAGYSLTGQGNLLIGDQAGYSISTGIANTFIGPNWSSAGACGYYVTTGSKNTILGAYNGNQGGLDIRTANNNIVLSDGDGNPRMYIDSNGGITQTATGATIVSVGIYNQTSGSASNLGVASNGIIYRSTSSLKYKRDVQNATHGLNEVMQLRPVTYKGKSENDGETVFGGLIAEEVHAAGLTEFVQYADDGTPDALAYGNMVALCFKAIQELNAKVEAQAAEIATLKGNA